MRGLLTLALLRDVQLGWIWYPWDAPPGCWGEVGTIPQLLRVMRFDLSPSRHIKVYITLQLALLESREIHYVYR